VVNKYLLRALYLNSFVQEIDYFSRSLNQKILPAFNDIDEEAKRVEVEAYERLSQVGNPEWFDPADIAEDVYHAGVDFAIMASGIVQGITNMFAAGLYHLFEQQFLKFHRKELLLPKEENEPSLLNLKEAQERLLRDYQIDIRTFESWSKLDELRLVSNCVKHADGPSCQQLKDKRLDLFVYPSSGKDESEMAFAVSAQVFQPLAGEGLYISVEEFNKYVEAVKQFWNELGKAFDLFVYKTSV
jgi:hypothetical protein